MASSGRGFVFSGRPDPGYRSPQPTLATLGNGPGRGGNYSDAKTTMGEPYYMDSIPGAIPLNPDTANNTTPPATITTPSGHATR
jgi:hypothetical protein